MSKNRETFQDFKRKEEISLCKQNIFLQSLVTFAFLFAGMHYAKKQSVVVPIIAAPSAATSASKLVCSIKKLKELKRVQE